MNAALVAANLGHPDAGRTRPWHPPTHVKIQQLGLFDALA